MNHDNRKQDFFLFGNTRVHHKITSFRGEENLPYDAKFGAPGPDATYAADGLETANC
jgi:hypothetical protein